MKLNILFGLVLMASVVLFGCISTGSSGDGEKVNAIVYKTQSCGCCGAYISYLQSKGFDVETKTIQDLSGIKEQYGIPADMQSCHTTVIGDYFVEGHVPVEAINKLLLDKPAISGIAMPGMPSGSPGMPGSKTAPFVINAISNGIATYEFMVMR